MISIFTTTIKRELYLKRLLESFLLLGGCDKVDFDFYIISQIDHLSDKMRSYISSLPFAKNIHTGFVKNITPVGTLLSETIKFSKNPIFFKIDDDCVLSSNNFLPRAIEVCSKMPKAIFYPFIIDGETPLRGKDSKNQCIYLEHNNLYLTVGDALMPSGKYFLPINLAKNIVFKDQNDAELVKITSLHLHIPVFQALNGIVIENQEGYSGQYHRKQNQLGQNI